jgi:hypothetical protein
MKGQYLLLQGFLAPDINTIHKPKEKQPMRKLNSKPRVTPIDIDKQIVKISSCPALSGNGEIGYEFSLNNKKALHIYITSNSGGGYFTSEQVALTEIESALLSQPDPSRLTSVALQPLFKGKSVNTPALLIAALRNEGFVKPIGELKRFHQCINAKSFKALIKKLQKLTLSSTTNQ